ncbi:PEP-CTERM protein-sorting domain-containing protein [Massilia sp. PDC64]|nr:PEP-CTERM sorting domain-containing protein [Massilia sp. PDC64]SDE63895.1 PEP-CTERM protein-sorting domain-containing protein [Massilia sp. PDC64]
MKSRVSTTRKLLAACAVTMATSAAHADITVYTDRTAYLNAVLGSATDTFDDLTMSETAGPLSRVAGGYAYQASAGPSEASFYPSGNGRDIWLSGTMASDVITFNGFSPNVFGFGGNFFGTDSFGAFMPGRTVVLSAVSGADIETYTLSNASQDSFIAFVSDHPLTSVSFRNVDSDGTVYWAAANNVVLAVPEPAAWTMLLGGLGITALARRRSLASNDTKTMA